MSKTNATTELTSEEGVKEAPRKRIALFSPLFCQPGCRMGEQSPSKKSLPSALSPACLPCRAACFHARALIGICCFRIKLRLCCAGAYSSQTAAMCSTKAAKIKREKEKEPRSPVFCPNVSLICAPSLLQLNGVLKSEMAAL